jgi:hypothetical protein
MPWLLRMLLILSFVILLGYGYVGRKLDWALAQLTPWSSPRRPLFIFLAVVLLNLYPAVTLVTYLMKSDIWMTAVQGGSRFIDLFLTYPFWVSVIFVLQLLPFLLLTDLGRFILAPLAKNPMTWTTWYAKLVLLLICVVAVYTVVRVYHDTGRIRVNERVIHSSKLAPQTPELRIIHITDVQMDRRTGPALIGAYVDKVNQLNPDVVFFSGDLITSGTEYIDQAAALLGRVKARYGVFACLGDHDIWADPEWVSRSLRERGIEVIEDEHRVINVGSTQIQLTGVTNVYNRRPKRDRLYQLANNQNDHLVSILLSHQPTRPLIEFARRNGYDLFLAGHTHGGQVVLNYFGIRLSVARRETRFVSGFYEVGNMLVSVSNGLGLTFAPVRFHAPAEITLLKLRPVEATR